MGMTEDEMFGWHHWLMLQSMGLQSQTWLSDWTELVPVHFSSLIPKMLMFTIAISFLMTSSLPWCMDLTFQVPMQCCFFTASDLTFIISHTTNWALFLLWLCLFILSGAISAVFSSSILCTSQPGEFIFQCPIFLLFHTVHGVLKARVLKWLSIPFSSGPHFVRTLHHDPSVLSGPTQHFS